VAAQFAVVGGAAERLGHGFFGRAHFR
jgi:hypothetical protein